MSKSISWYAKRYVEKFGFHLVPIEPKRKFPRSSDWGNNCLTSPESAEAFYKENPDWNMGCALGGSRMCSLDIDCMESFKIILDEFGIPSEELDKFPTIQGASKGTRVMFRVPDGADLKYQKLNWPQKEDPKKQFTVLELRAATDGKQRQDVLPPSIHPDTGEPYRWITQPSGTIESWPEPPAWLMSVWEAWDQFKPQFRDACPWLEKEKRQAIPRKAVGKPRTEPVGSDVIGQYQAEVSIEAALEVYGYTPMGKRWLSPHSGTGLAGVNILPDGQRCWIHHASDPLCSDDSDSPVNSFDLFCYYEHGGDISKAVKAAAKSMGIVQEPNRTPNPQPADQYESYPEMLDHDGDGFLETGNSSSNYPERKPVDYHNPLPWCTAKGKPLNHLENLAAICHRLGVIVRYNVISKEEEIIVPDQSFSIDNKANASLAWLTSECSRFDFPTSKISDFVTFLSDKNLHNPVANWIESNPWDGTDRLQALFNTVIAKGEDFAPDENMDLAEASSKAKEADRIKWLKEALIKRWMISAIVAGFNPTGVSAQGVLVFQGNQDLGKTRWLESLVPSNLELVKDGMILKPEDKDSVKQCCSFWLVELGELDSTFRRSDIAALKAFITSKLDVLRRAYARKESRFARRTVFFGSVNPKSFLHDETGNRRYWTIKCESINHEHGLDMQQVWAQVKTLRDNGEQFHLTKEEAEALNQSNEEFMAIDSVKEKLLSALDWDQKDAFWEYRQATEVLIDCGFDKPTRSDAATAAQLIRLRNGGAEKRSGGKNLLFCPPVKKA